MSFWRNLGRRCPPTQRAAAGFVLLVGLVANPLVSAAQNSPPQPPAAQSGQTAPANQPPIPASPGGKVLFSRDASTVPSSPVASQGQDAAANADGLKVTDEERNAVTFVAYDLDVHLTPATAGISARAVVTLRNDGGVPLKRIALQISSSLHWDAISAETPGAAIRPLVFASHRVETDADHTGAMEEAAISLPEPLAPGASTTIRALYSGSIARSAERLERIGAPANEALAADWDAVAPPDPDGESGGSALRGFGNVLWYPVSAPPVFLGDGAKFFQEVGATKLRESAAMVRLRLAVEYVGDPPDAAFFCGRREQLTAISDDPNLPAAESPGIATASFEARPLGFRTPNLFVTAGAPTSAGPAEDSYLLEVVTGHYDALPAYAAAATQVQPLLTDWFGPQPLGPLTILDHPGQPFEDDALLVRPVRGVDAATLEAPLVHSLTHAWIHSSHAWIDEGLAEFASLLWTERTAGGKAALAELQDSARTLALAEPAVPMDVAVSASSSSSDSAPPAEHAAPVPGQAAGPQPSFSAAGKSLAEATGEVFYRTKARAVWWMLRGIAGDEALKKTLQAYRLDAKLDHDPQGLERTLEKFSHMDLQWFFYDWVYRDRGLPDLSIVSVTPSQLETHSGQPSGWLVAVVVHNDGYAEAEVPVTVRSAASTETQWLRIPGRATASTRIVFAGTPQEVQVNDGSVPETETSIHVRQLVTPHS